MLHDLLSALLTKKELLKWLDSIDAKASNQVDTSQALVTLAYDSERLLGRLGFLGNCQIYCLLVRSRPNFESEIWLVAALYGANPPDKVALCARCPQRWKPRLYFSIRKGYHWVVLLLLASVSTLALGSYISKLTLLPEKVRELRDIARAASTVAVSYKAGKGSESKSWVEYEKLYWSHIILIDDPLLRSAMDELRHELRYFDKGYEPIDGGSARDLIIKKAHLVAQKCSDAIERIQEGRKK